MAVSDIPLHTQEIFIPGLQKEYRLFHITDSHLVHCEKEIFHIHNPDIAGSPESRTAMFTSVEGISAQEHFNRQHAFLTQHADELDAVLMTGDILDFNSPLADVYLDDFLSSLPLPHIMTVGNHDRFYYTHHTPPQPRPNFQCVRIGDTYVQKLRVGELALVGVDNPLSLYEDGVANALEEMLMTETHVLMLQHVPLYTPKLHEAILPLRGCDLSIGGEAICRNDNWKLVKELITRPQSPVRALITGHLHFSHSSALEGQAVQYISPSVHDTTTVFYVHG